MEQALKQPEIIRDMFARIAPAYDLNNRLHSLWRDQAWRRLAARLAGLSAGESALDVACGTGDLTALLARTPDARVVGLDFCKAMLDLARRKFPNLRVEWVVGDAMALPFPDGSFDSLTIAFGLRNVPDAPAALREFHRILRHGGRLVVLEFTGGPPAGPAQRLLRFYTDAIMPRTAGLIARDRSGAYHYLHRSIHSFWSAEEMTAQMTAAGFVDVSAHRLTLGLAHAHLGRRPQHKMCR
jgi:demethylmenaquinone methyltransferase / 2-methoxy-6-polyprenyl-1,4-benzoquinol methylase